VKCFCFDHYKCEYPKGENENAADGDDEKKKKSSVKILAISDVHVLDNRRRTWIEKYWIDWQVREDTKNKFGTY